MPELPTPRIGTLIWLTPIEACNLRFMVAVCPPPVEGFDSALANEKADDADVMRFVRS